MQLNFFKVLCLLLFFSSTTLQAQYAKVTFDSKVPFKLEVDGQKIYKEGSTKMIKLRLNRGESYNMRFLHGETGQEILAFPYQVGKKQKSGSYKIKYKKKKGTYRLITKSKKDKGPSLAKRIENIQNTEFTVETEESYSGPDGAYSKSSKTEGTLGNHKTEKSNVEADQDGISMEHSVEEKDNTGIADAAKGAEGLGKLFKRKKKKDNRRVVVLKAK